MKYMIAVVLYYVGDVISRIMQIKYCGWLYPIYNKIMLKSCQLDVKGTLWTRVEDK